MTFFNLLTQNASPIELLILAWIAYRVEKQQRAIVSLEREILNLDARTEELENNVRH